MNKWRYFINPRNNWGYRIVLIVSNEEGGYLFKNNGTLYDGYGTTFVPNYTTRNCLSAGYKDVKFFKAIKQIDKSAHEEICKLLKISYPFDIKLTEDTKKCILENLRTNYAFNADSAQPMENYNECYILTEEKVIGEYKGKFYLLEN